MFDNDIRERGITGRNLRDSRDSKLSSKIDFKRRRLSERKAESIKSRRNSATDDSERNYKRSEKNPELENKISKAAGPMPPSESPEMLTPMGPPGQDSNNQQQPSPPNMPPMGQPPQGPPGGAPNRRPNVSDMPSPAMSGGGTTIEEIEEVVETIIDERWKEVTENIKKVIDWKNLMDQKFERMDQEIKDLKENFNELYKAIVGKIGDYDTNLLKVGAELKAMEKVFSQVLPTFTENVNDLSRIADDMRIYFVKKKSGSKNSE